MLYYEPTYPVQLVFFEAPIPGQRNGGEPEFGDVPITFDMDVSRFTLVGTDCFASSLEARSRLFSA